MRCCALLVVGWLLVGQTSIAQMARQSKFSPNGGGLSPAGLVISPSFLRRVSIRASQQLVTLEVMIREDDILPEDCTAELIEGAVFNPFTPGSELGRYSLRNEEEQLLTQCPIMVTEETLAIIDCPEDSPFTQDLSIQREDNTTLTLRNSNPSLPMGQHRFEFESLIDLTASTVEILLLTQLQNRQVDQVNKLAGLGGIIPFITAGVLGDLEVLPTLVLTNGGGTPIELMYEAVAERVFRLDGNLRSSAFYRIDPGATRLVRIESANTALTSGAALFTISPKAMRKDVRAALTYSTFRNQGVPAGSGNQELVGEAGLETGDLASSLLFSVEKDVDAGVDTAIALTNPTSARAFLDMVLVETSTGQTAAEKSLRLESGETQARFVGSWLEVELGDFIGTLVLTSSADLGAISLRTLDGIQTSSLPAVVVR